MTTDVALDAPDLGESVLVCQMPIGAAEDVAAWIDNASHNDSVIYFVGHLAVARDAVTRPFGRAMAERIDDMANVVLRAANDGRLILSQKRIADGAWLYIMRRLTR